jgi:hypothetical protein
MRPPRGRSGEMRPRLRSSSSWIAQASRWRTRSCTLRSRTCRSPRGRPRRRVSRWVACPTGRRRGRRPRQRRSSSRVWCRRPWSRQQDLRSHRPKGGGKPRKVLVDQLMGARVHYSRRATAAAVLRSKERGCCVFTTKALLVLGHGSLTTKASLRFRGWVLEFRDTCIHIHTRVGQVTVTQNLCGMAPGAKRGWTRPCRRTAPRS